MLKRILHNVFWENSNLVARLLINLFLVRFVLQKFGIVKFGIFSFWLALTSYIVLFLDLGVSLTAPLLFNKLLKRHKFKEIVTRFIDVYLLRLFLGGVSFILILFVNSLYSFITSSVLIILIFFSILEGIANSNWLIIGLEKYKLRTLDIIALLLWFISLFYVNNVLYLVMLRYCIFFLKDVVVISILIINYLRKIKGRVILILIQNSINISNFINLTKLLRNIVFNYFTGLFSTGYRKLILIIPRFLLSPYEYGIFSGVYKLVSLLGEVQVTITRPLSSVLASVLKTIKYKRYLVYSTITVIFLTIVGMFFIGIPFFSSIVVGKMAYTTIFAKFVDRFWLLAIFWSLTGHLNILFMILKRFDKLLVFIMFVKIMAFLVLGILSSYFLVGVELSLFFNTAIGLEIFNFLSIMYLMLFVDKTWR